MIECSLQPIAFKYLKSEDKKPKYGIYLQSMYWNVKGYGKKVWMVAVKISLPDYGNVKELYETNDEIIQKCVEFLNTPPKSKYGKKRRRQPLYGKFRDEPHSFKLKVKNGKPIIQALLVTERRKSKYFWGEGQKANYSTWRRRKKQ